MPVKTIPSLILVATLVTVCACSNEATDKSSGDTQTAAASPASTGDAEFDGSLKCWALTNTAYFQHMAMTGHSGNLPKPEEAVYTSWAKKNAILAFERKMNFKDYQAVQERAKSEVRIYSLTVEPDYAANVQACIDTTPDVSAQADPSWPESMGG
ncbi:hypothetical protein ACFOWX_01030 [Sphingorhabdus arenilitoris]|uniref:Uncharacterized protein n=1 Tax=Sphingorhabdus arenilitoris TaxID=1490041 RepID=A0ABV8RCD8_9SPHN